MIVYILIMKKN